ncbi:MAG: efflux RND transporter periplasmic adaptor subunit [Gemmataceae bacterium]|nr:efflux RND transporter periplasmic adaptor subunit [Gemmataceae bacterium]
MNTRRAVLTGLLFALLCAAVGGVVWWLVSLETSGAAKPAAPPAPALVPRPLKEDQINAITLTPEAVERLALRPGVVERKPVRTTRVYGGEVMVPAGQTTIVSAPLAGTLKAPPEGAPRPGQTVKKGQPMVQLLPLLTPEGLVNLTVAKIEADGQVKSTQTQLDAAQIALDRAQRLLRGQAGSKRAVDEAQAQVDLARKAVEAATARRNLLQKVVGQLEKGTAAPLPIEAPEGGLVRNVSALPGQTVPSGATLFEVVSLDRVWVRVPVYVGDLPEVDRDDQALITALTARPGDPGLAAKPAAAPPSANPTAGTVDLFYDLDNRAARYSPGHRVGVHLKLKGEAVSLTVPWAAVIHDIHGGTWVYEQAGERAYVRRRVVLRFVTGQTAVLAAGPAPGTRVVVAGAAELFGTETGFSK